MSNRDREELQDSLDQVAECMDELKTAVEQLTRDLRHSKIPGAPNLASRIDAYLTNRLEWLVKGGGTNESGSIDDIQESLDNLFGEEDEDPEVEYNEEESRMAESERSRQYYRR